MTTQTSLVNLALQSFGSRTTITDAQLLAGSNNEAKQANLTFANTRDSLLRLAPWDCAMKTANLVYITSTHGTPENTSAVTNLWAPGQPRPPWAYEYQYPTDCLRACWIIPATQTGYAGGVPITTAVTGGAPTLFNGPAIRFKVGIDQFLMAAASNILITAPGTGYAVGDTVTAATVLVGPITNSIGSFLANAPQGAPLQMKVATINGAGGILSVTVVPQIIDSDPALGGSYFIRYYADNGVGSTTGLGTGATFNIAISDNILHDQRVILTNQEFATLVYIRQVTDPNIWDPMFQDAFIDALGGDLCMALTGDKSLTKICYGRANQAIDLARAADGNEGLTVNNITPDWIRGRGINWTDGLISGPYSNFDWGGAYGNLA